MIIQPAPPPAIILPAPPQLVRPSLILPTSAAFLSIPAMLFAPPPVITLTDNVDDTSNLTTYSFATRNIGNGGLVVVCAAGRHNTLNTRTVASGTIGGSAATLAVASAANFVMTGILTRVVYATTATIEVTFSAGVEGCYIAVYVVTGFSSDVASDTAHNTGTATSIAATGLDFPSKGVAAVAFEAFNTETQTISKGSIGNQTTTSTPATKAGGASYTADNAESSQTFTVSSASSNSRSIAAAVFR